jgi:thioesterase domain-containing protein
VPNTCHWLFDFLRLDASDQRKFIARKLRAIHKKLFNKRAAQKAVDIESYLDTSHFPAEELKLWQLHLNAGAAYHPKPYSGRVILLRTRGQAFLCSLDPRFGWGELAQDGVEIRMLAGSHENIFVEPDVRVLAAQVAACLRATCAGGCKPPSH